MFKSNAIHVCTFCGEKTSGKFCPGHRKKEGRIADIEKQLAIEKERGTKTQKIFGYDRKALLKRHGMDENL